MVSDHNANNCEDDAERENIQKEPTRLSNDRGESTGLSGGISEGALPAGVRLGALEGLAMESPYEKYECTIRKAPRIRNFSTGVIKRIVPKPA